MTEDAASEYLRLASECQSVIYDDARSIQKFNNASDRMRQIVQKAETAGSHEVLPLIRLLTDPVAAIWIAHHLVELATLDSTTREKCFSIVRETAASLEQNGVFADAMGERMWLEEWETK